MQVDVINFIFALGGAAVTGFGVAFWVYHKNKVARNFQALVASVKAELTKGTTPTPPAA